MKKLLALGVLGLGFIGCDPNIPRSRGGSSFVIAIFDPANNMVPTPTNLVTGPNGLLRIPVSPSASPAQQELVAYLNTLDGYASDSPAKANFDGLLDPSTVNSTNVRVLDFGPSPAPVGNAAISFSPSGAGGQINIAPPAGGGWTMGKTYAIAIIGGSSGVKGASGETVIGSSTFLLVRSRNSLVSNCTQPVLATGECNPDCQTTTDVIPSSQTDPAVRFADQSCSAARLELIRKSIYGPLFAYLESQGISRDNVPLVWMFKVASRPVVAFDPENQVIPFPNNVVLSVPTDGGRPSVNLLVPNVTLPDGGVPLAIQLLRGLNTLDGFSTTAPLVSQNSTQPSAGALAQGDVDPQTVGPASAGVRFLSNLPGGGPGHPPTVPSVKPCVTPTDPTCAPNPLPDGGTPTYRSQIVMIPQVPFDERSTYGAYISTGVKDTSGRNVIASSAFALARLANPLFDGTKSTVDLISDAQARQLEPLRAALKPFIDGLVAAAGLSRNNIALAWAFTTQSEVSTLKTLRAVPTPLSPDPLFIQELPLGSSCPGGSCPNVSHFVVGEILVPVLLSPTTGVFDPTTLPSIKVIPFLLTIPAGAAPLNGYPVTVFGHGLQRARTDMINIADRLAFSGHAAIAIDVVWHGERTSCIGSRTALGQSSDDAACVQTGPPQQCAPTGRCIRINRATPNSCGTSPNPDLTCLLASQGMCHTDGFCEGGDYARDASNVPLISGWNLLNLTNLFATRDNFRQQVIDLSQLARTIASTTPTTSLNARLVGAYTTQKLDPNKINYVGQSLGGILGTLFTSVSPVVHNVVLNVPGADPVNILLTSKHPALTAARNAFIGALASQVPPIAQGTLDFAQFTGTARWILDPADPQNMGFSVKNGSDVPSDRKALIQYILGDLVVPNPTTEELIAAANRTGSSSLTDFCLFQTPPFTSLADSERHGFLLNFAGGGAATTAVQSRVASYISTGSAPPCP